LAGEWELLFEALLEGVWRRVLRSPPMMPLQVVIDTNVLVAALRSRHGGSAALLQKLGADPRWQVNLSVSPVAEYIEMVHREGRPLG
jgi:predicted nucleic acid-binding protein